MRPILIALALIALCVGPAVSSLDARGCRGGACSVQTADLTPAKFDAAKHPRDPETGRFTPAPKAAAANVASDCGSMRQPIRKAGKVVGKAARAAGRVLLAPFRFLRRGHRCG